MLRFLAGGAAVTVVGITTRVAVKSDSMDGPGPTSGGFTLATDSGDDIGILRIALGDDLAPRVAARSWETTRLPTSAHSMVAVTWPISEASPECFIRSRQRGSWGGWTRLADLHDAPDESTSRSGTDLMWIGRSDGVQVRIEGRRPDGLELVLFHPQRRLVDAFIDASVPRAAPQASAGRSSAAPQPTLIRRPQWGADESLRGSRPTYNHTIRQIHVHHTVNSNTYDRDDVPALIRGMYAYHTRTLGWSDIAYNFLVDRFGRSFVGRAGGPAKLVRGSHTLGFNAESTGVSAIGNYETAKPTEPLIAAIAAIAAWKLDPYSRNPEANIKVTSEGSDKFSDGRVVSLPVIDGHRDTNDTACPGLHLYAALPAIRRRAAQAVSGDANREVSIGRAAAIVNGGNATGTEAGTVRIGDQLAVQLGSYRPSDAVATYQWLRGSQPIRAARNQTYEVTPRDVGLTLTCRVRLARDGFTAVDQSPPAVGPVTTESTLSIGIEANGRKVRVAATLTGPTGVEVIPTGKVAFLLGDRLKTIVLTSGAAQARFGGSRPLRTGSYDVAVTYSGDQVFAATSGTTIVEIA